MNVRPALPLSQLPADASGMMLPRDEFRNWVQRQDARYEWVRGRAVMMAGVSRYHGRLLRNLIVALSTRLDFDAWDVQAESFGVELPESLRYPDLVIEPRAGENDYAATNPVAMVEILSPSSVKTDMFDKPAEYFTLPTLRSYLVLSQDAPVAWLWRRAPGAAAPTVPEEFAGRAAEVPIDGLDLSLPLAELYRGIPDGDPALTTTPAG